MWCEPEGESESIRERDAFRTGGSATGRSAISPDKVRYRTRKIKDFLPGTITVPTEWNDDADSAYLEIPPALSGAITPEKTQPTDPSSLRI